MNRPPLFPRDTGSWPAYDASRLRSLTRSALLAGLATGVLLRFVRLSVFSRDTGPLLVVAALVAGIVLLCGMLTLVLANYPLRRWPLHVLGFWLAEVTAEMATSALLIAAGLEPRGSSARARFHDLPDMATNTLLVRGVIVGVFALVLAGVVQVVRARMGRGERVKVQG